MLPLSLLSLLSSEPWGADLSGGVLQFPAVSTPGAQGLSEP